MSGRDHSGARGFGQQPGSGQQPGLGQQSGQGMQPSSGSQSGSGVQPGFGQQAQSQGGADGRAYTYGMGNHVQAPPTQPQGYVPGAPQQPGRAYARPGQSQPMPGQQAYIPPATSVPQQPPRKPKRRRAAIVGVLIAVVCLLMAAALAFTMCGNGKGRRSGTAGQLENKTPEEIQAEIDRQVEEGMFNISIASAVQFADGASEGELRIENVPGNRYLMTVQITLDDTGQTVYQTDIIEPDHHIQRDRLLVDLPAGNYNATATFTALDPQTEEQVGQAAAKVVLIIQS